MIALALSAALNFSLLTFFKRHLNHSAHPSSATGQTTFTAQVGTPTATPTPAANYSAPPARHTPQRGLSDNDMERLEKIAALRDRGVLTPEEFEAEKAAILASAGAP